VVYDGGTVSEMAKDVQENEELYEALADNDTDDDE